MTLRLHAYTTVVLNLGCAAAGTPLEAGHAGPSHRWGLVLPPLPSEPPPVNCISALLGRHCSPYCMRHTHLQIQSSSTHNSSCACWAVQVIMRFNSSKITTASDIMYALTGADAGSWPGWHSHFRRFCRRDGDLEPAIDLERRGPADGMPQKAQHAKMQHAEVQHVETAHGRCSGRWKTGQQAVSAGCVAPDVCILGQQGAVWP